MDTEVANKRLRKTSFIRHWRHRILKQSEETLSVTRYVFNSASWILRKISLKLEMLPLIKRGKPTEEQVCRQSNLILRDYLKHEIEGLRRRSKNPMVTVSELHYRGLDDSALSSASVLSTTSSIEEKVDIIGGFLELNFPEVSDVSKEMTSIGTELQNRYPNLFSNIGNNLRINIQSCNQLLSTYNTVANELFRFDITWIKVIAFFVVTGNLFIECAIDGQEQNTYALIDAFQKIIRRRLAEWVIHQGGWTALALHTQKLRTSSLTLQAYSFVGLLVGLGVTILPWTWSKYSSFMT